MKRRFSIPKKLQAAAVATLLLLPALDAVGEETARIAAVRDVTLIEDPDGALANGSGPYFFVGRTRQVTNGVRRGLLYFDIAGALPGRAIIKSASLTLYMESNNPQLREIRLHRVLADWGEGASVASGGAGAPAQAGDATWLHTFYDQDFWLTSGGQFVGRPSGRRAVAASGWYTWPSTAEMVRDVQLWSSAPQRNFGWILIGDESTRQTSKSFASRDHPEIALRPLLEVTYRVPGPVEPRPGSR